MPPPPPERGSVAQPRKEVAAAPASARLKARRSMAGFPSSGSRCARPRGARPPGRLPLGLAAGDARGVLELAPERKEGVAQGEIGILVVAVARHELLAGNAQVDADVKEAAARTVPAQFLDVDAAAHDARVKLLELLRDLADPCLERR